MRDASRDSLESVLAGVGDHVAAAVLITGENGRLLWANAAAREWIAVPDLLAVEDSRLVAAARAAERLLSAAAGLGCGDACSERCEEYLVYIERLRPDPQDVFAHMRHFVTWRVTGPPIEGIVRRRNLREHFGATRREAEVGDLVAGGFDIPEIADRLATAPSTIRTHLKRLFAKTGTHGQQQLAARVRQGILRDT